MKKCRCETDSLLNRDLEFIDKKAKEFVVHPFKVGDIVCLKSGGGAMTISSLGR